VTVVDKSVQDLRTRAERDARARLDPDRWTMAYTAGRTSSMDALLKDIDSVLKRGRPPIVNRQSDAPVKPKARTR
jgi:hypothetical protein